MASSYSPGNYATPPPPPPKPPGVASSNGVVASGRPIQISNPNQNNSSDDLQAYPAPHHLFPPAHAPPHQLPQIPGGGPALPPPGWLPHTMLETATTTTALKLALEHPNLISNLPYHPTERPESLAAVQQHLTNEVNNTIALAENVMKLEKSVKQSRGTVQKQLLEVMVLERQFRDEQKQRDAQLEVFGPRMLFRKVCAGVEEGERAVAEIEKAFLEGRPLPGSGSGQDSTQPFQDREQGDADGRGDENKDGANLASEGHVLEYVKRLREAKKILFLRKQHKERWEEGRVGGWRY